MTMGRFVWIAACVAALVQGQAGAANFAEFDRKARDGERLNVVFFGASLTWGANATDPLKTSYRAVVARRMEEAYPKAHFRFHDAAIGGTGSQLGVFRLERDVLRHRPDLVFVDFSANDDINSANPETLASYEAIVRRIIVEAKAPVVQVIFPFKWNVAAGKTDGMKRRDAHLAIAAAYSIPVGDAIALAIDRVKSGQTTLERIWPVDGVHPCDEGYILFADAAWDALQEGIRGQRTCTAPAKMLHTDTYTRSARVRLSSLAPLPEGWQAGRPNLTSAYFDMLMSRWLDGLAIATSKKPAARFKLKVSASMVMLFGESTPTSGQYRIHIDGKLVERIDTKSKQAKTEFDAGELARRSNGNVHLAHVLVENLDSTREHILEIEPVFSGTTPQELRIESICVAGGAAKVERVRE